MDPKILELAQKIGAFLLPLLPYLIKAGEKAAEEAGKKIGGEAWDKAKALWGKLGRKERVQKAAETAVALPDNPAIQQGLETEIARALEEDAALREQVAQAVQSEVIQRVLAERGGRIADVEQSAQGGPTRQEVIARDDSEIKGVKQIRL
jgi:hypothetical protein